MLRKTILSQSLLIAFSAVSLSLAVAPVAYAQSTTVGSVFGQVAAQAGDQVVIENAAVGLKRVVPVAANGTFQAVALPPGKYTATLQKGGTTVSSVQLEVRAGQGSEVSFASGSANAQLGAVMVVGRAKTIDVSSSENGSTFSAKQLEALPVATKDLNGIIALAANTVKADNRYAGGVSIGGGGPSENAYYINGFPVTNALTQLGSIELPFGAVAQADIKTGGFGAEFGRSVGGVVNITTKSGSNEWHGGVGIEYSPSALAGKRPDGYYPDTKALTGYAGNASTDGKLYIDRSKSKESEYAISAYAGGPLIKDKLFFFLAADHTRKTTSGVNSPTGSSLLSTNGWLDATDKNTRYLGKIDWFLTDDHQLELTLIGDNYKTTNEYSGYDYATGSKGKYVYTEYAKNEANITPGVGGDAQVLKYTGNVTNNFTLTALYGQSRFNHSNTFSFPPTAPTFGWNATGRNPNLKYVEPADAPNPLPSQTLLTPAGAHDTTKSFRLDGELRLGDHTVRAGMDENRLRSVGAGQTVAGGHSWLYRSTSNGNANVGGDGAISKFTSPVNGRYYYVIDYIFDDATAAQSNQSAMYIEDRWKITKNLLVTGGLRNESFVNKNGDGETFLESKNFVSPRLAAAWDVNGDASLKVYGSAGRYSLQIPTHVAVRGASRSLYTTQYFTYSGVDQTTGLPTGLTSMGRAVSTNNEYGQPKDVQAVAAKDIKPTYQDEMTLGFEKALTPNIMGGAKVTYRTLRETIDDLCDARAFYAYADVNKINTDNYAYTCASFNPGSDNTFLVGYAGADKPHTSVTFTGAQLGFEKAKRTYLALDFYLEHALRDGWYGKLTYTWSRSKGNTEGQTRSDNAQTDVAATSTWDLPELMEGSYGVLPNDRTHQIKAYGFYQFTPELAFGANAMLESGRPRSCFGNYPGATSADDVYYYNSVNFYCDGKLTPRGSLGRTPWTYKLDLNATYKPANVKGLTLRMDVFNVFNTVKVTRYDEIREPNRGDLVTVSSTYGREAALTAPRSVRLSASYDF